MVISFLVLPLLNGATKLLLDLAYLSFFILLLSSFNHLQTVEEERTTHQESVCLQLQSHSRSVSFKTDQVIAVSNPSQVHRSATKSLLRATLAPVIGHPACFLLPLSLSSLLCSLFFYHFFSFYKNTAILTERRWPLSPLRWLFLFVILLYLFPTTTHFLQRFFRVCLWN